jgi:hypothetical protein
MGNGPRQIHKTLVKITFLVKLGLEFDVPEETAPARFDSSLSRVDGSISTFTGTAEAKLPI